MAKKKARPAKPLEQGNINNFYEKLFYKIKGPKVDNDMESSRPVHFFKCNGDAKRQSAIHRNTRCKF